MTPLKFLKETANHPVGRGFSLSCINCGDVLAAEANSFSGLLTLLVTEGWGVLDISAVETAGGKGICASCRA